MNDEIKNYIDQAIALHLHDGNFAQRVNVYDLFGTIPSRIPLDTATIATTGNTDGYIIAPITGTITSVDFSGVDALAASDTNYITWTITNLGQAGSGTTAILSSAASNTTKVTGGTALSANTKRSLVLTSVTTDLNVIEGDRLRVRAAATGTLANTVTFPTYIIRFN